MKNSFKKNIFVKKIILILISIVIVFIIEPPIKRYSIKDYEKFAKKHGIQYEVINCPNCGTKVPDTIQFCYNCNEILFDADEKTIEMIDKVNENVEKLKKSDPIGNLIEKINIVLFYVTMITIMYGLFILLETILKFIRRLFVKFKSRVH